MGKGREAGKKRMKESKWQNERNIHERKEELNKREQKEELDKIHIQGTRKKCFSSRGDADGMRSAAASPSPIAKCCLLIS